MVKVCPDCGAFVEEEADICPNCNTLLKDVQYTREQPYPVQQKTSKAKILAIIAVIIIVCSVIVIAFLLLNQNADPAAFIGDWIGDASMTGSSSSTTTYWSFYENGTAQITAYQESSENSPNIVFQDDQEGYTATVTSLTGWSEQWMNYELRSGKMYLSPQNAADTSAYAYFAAFGFDYSFSNSNRFTLSVSLMGQTVAFTFTRTNEHPAVQIYEDLGWENINFSTEISGGYADITLSRSSVPYSGDHAPAEWEDIQVGDVIEFITDEENLYVTVTWIPEDEEIDYFFFWGPYVDW